MRLLPLLLLLVACEPPQTKLTNLGSVGVSVDGGTPSAEASFDFGVLKLGTSALATVTVTNTGQDPLTVTNVSLLAADTGAFFVRGSGGKLSAGATLMLEVTFGPVRAGAQTARLAVEHDAAAPAAILALHGSGSP